VQQHQQQQLQAAGEGKLAVLPLCMLKDTVVLGVDGQLAGAAAAAGRGSRRSSAATGRATPRQLLDTCSRSSSRRLLGWG
jgi:hypothetical protein